MGVLFPNYPQVNVVKGENVPDFSKNRSSPPHGTGSSTSNVFQILNNIQKRQRVVQCQYNSSPVAKELQAPLRTTTPFTPAMTAEQVDSVHVHTLPVQNTSWSGPPAHCAHVHKPPKQVCKPGELLALRKVQHPLNGSTSVNRLPLTKQDILSHYSGCLEGIGRRYTFSRGTIQVSSKT